MDRYDLLKELKAFKPYNTAEADSVSQTIQFIENEQDAFHRHLAKGHVCGSALLVGYDGAKVLLMYHKGLKRWVQFGGHADGNEDIFDVASRETDEECGINKFKLLSNGIADVDVHVIPDRPERNEAEHLHYDIRYIFITDETEFKLGDKGVGALKWCDYEEAKGLVTGGEMHRLLDKWRALTPQAA